MSKGKIVCENYFENRPPYASRGLPGMIQVPKGFKFVHQDK